MNFKKPSAKINLAVAGAVGIDAFIFQGECLKHTDRPTLVEPFSPSREWKDAMDAVKAFLHKYPNVIEQQLFMSRIRRIVCSEDREATWQWVFFLLVKAGPLALCAAILKTPKGKPDADEND